MINDKHKLIEHPVQFIQDFYHDLADSKGINVSDCWSEAL
jgi:hypothetical protein